MYASFFSYVSFLPRLRVHLTQFILDMLDTHKLGKNANLYKANSVWWDLGRDRGVREVTDAKYNKDEFEKRWDIHTFIFKFYFCMLSLLFFFSSFLLFLSSSLPLFLSSCLSFFLFFFFDWK